METTTVNAVMYIWRLEDGSYYVKIYDSESGIFGGGSHKDLDTAKELAKTTFKAEYKGLIDVSDCDVEVTHNLKKENDV